VSGFFGDLLRVVYLCHAREDARGPFGRCARGRARSIWAMRARTRAVHLRAFWTARVLARINMILPCAH